VGAGDVLKIYTNNPEVKNNHLPVVYHRKSCEELLIILRDQIHLGGKLLSDPMPGSRRMLESPFRSVVLATSKNKGHPLDIHSLQTIEKAIRHYRRIKELKTPVAETVLADFQQVDKQLLNSTLKELGIG
jgi:hypothetical protein